VLRSLVKTVIAGTLHASGLERIARPHRAGLPLIIAYHQVVDEFARGSESAIPAMLISTGMLARHLDWLARRFRFVSLDEVGELACGAARRRGKPAVAITFDDGYSHVYEKAFPILRSKGVPAGLFVVTESIGKDELLVHDRLFVLLRNGSRRWRQPVPALMVLLAQAGVERDRASRLAALGCRPDQAAAALLDDLRRSELSDLLRMLERDLGVCAVGESRSLDWDMLAEMAAAGMTIGSHTRSHVWMNNESRATQHQEAAGSRSDLEHRLGRPIDHFAYPGGAFDAMAVQAVEQAGYRFGYTTCDHRDVRRPLLTIPRKVFWERTCLGAFSDFSESIMSCHTSGVFGRSSCVHLPRRFKRRAA
jgi:peptidoglycan/xylan/chitin deacetylase (PgdA/CDA1 family)